MQLQVRRILWPTDFSELSMRAARYARALRSDFSAELHLIHVIPPPLSPNVSVMLPADVPVTVTEPDMLQAARDGLTKLVHELFPNEPGIHTESLLGNPWSAICEYAEQQQIDLILIPTHGRTGLRHVLIGSTAERVVQHAPCPVLTIKDGGRHFVTS